METQSWEGHKRCRGSPCHQTQEFVLRTSSILLLRACERAHGSPKAVSQLGFQPLAPGPPQPHPLLLLSPLRPSLFPSTPWQSCWASVLRPSVHTQPLGVLIQPQGVTHANPFSFSSPSPPGDPHTNAPKCLPGFSSQRPHSKQSLFFSRLLHSNKGHGYPPCWESFLMVFPCTLQLPLYCTSVGFSVRTHPDADHLSPCHCYHPDPKPLSSQHPKRPSCFCPWPLPLAYSLPGLQELCKYIQSRGRPSTSQFPGRFHFCPLFGLLTLARRLSVTRTLPPLRPFCPVALCALPPAPSSSLHLPPTRMLPLRASAAQRTAWLIRSALEQCAFTCRPGGSNTAAHVLLILL